MATGSVKWFDDAKGYGFITRGEDEREEIFVHYSQIVCDGFKFLREGEVVDFELRRGPRGPHAARVMRREA